LGIASFFALSYVIVPFQAYAAVKGFLERQEGPWFRTPKTGRITDVFTRGKFMRFIAGILPGKSRPNVATNVIDPNVSEYREDHSYKFGEFQFVDNPYIALATANNKFNNFNIKSVKGSRRIGRLGISIVILITLMINTAGLYVKPVKAYDSNWLYRKKLTIGGSTAGAQSDFQMQVIVHASTGTDSGMDVYCNDHCNSDFGDVRFTESDGDTDLDYWRQNFTSGTNATFWVEVDSIAASPDTTDIYLYYGNSSATTTSNGENTFEFFDDFSGDLSKWTIDSENTEAISISSGALRHDPDSSQTKNSYFDTRIQTTTYKILNGVLEYSVYLAGSSSSSPRIIHQMGWRVQSTEFQNGYVWRVQNSATDGGHLKINGRASWGTFGTSYPAITGNVWHTVKETISGSNFTGYVDGGSGYSGSDSTKTTADYLVSHVHGVSLGGSSYVLVDDVRVRKYANPEPSYDSWGSEEEVPEISLLLFPLAIIIPYIIVKKREYCFESGLQ
jgi:hypothetical protein